MSPIGSYVGGLTSKGQVGVLLGEHRRWILRMAALIKGRLSDNRPEAFAASFQTSEGEHQHAFLFPNIEDSTFHPADCRGRLQTIRQFRRSDFRRSTQACFPLFIHSGINYPPAAGWSPFLSRKELRFASFPFLSFGILAFYKNAILRIRLQIGFANLPLVSNL